MLETKFYKIKIVLENMKKDHVSESSAECAYYVILSFIPFVMLVLTLIQYTSLKSDQLLEIIYKIIPNNTKELLIGIIMEVYSKSIGTVSISLVFTIYSASRGLFALIKELHNINHYVDSRSKSWIYLKVISLLQTIVFLVTVVSGLIAMVFGKTIFKAYKEKMGLLTKYTINATIITRILFLVVFFILLLIMYKFLSGHKIKIKSQIRGAAVASFAINIISYIFSRYLEIFKGFSTTYGSLTAMILVMMWTYACFYIIFLGAEINKFYNSEIITLIKNN